MNDPIERQAAIDAVDPETVSTNPEHFKLNANEKFIKFMDDADIASFGEWQWENGFNAAVVAAKIQLEKLPSAEPEQRYTEEELRVFAHGISLSLLSKRSAQHWQYDKDTATEIEFLERLYDKVSADMKGGQG